MQLTDTCSTAGARSCAKPVSSNNGFAGTMRCCCVCELDVAYATHAVVCDHEIEAPGCHHLYRLASLRCVHDKMSVALQILCGDITRGGFVIHEEDAEHPFCSESHLRTVDAHLVAPRERQPEGGRSPVRPILWQQGWDNRSEPADLHFSFRSGRNPSCWFGKS